MAVDPWASTNQGLGNLSNTLASLAQLKRQDQQYADEAPERANRQTLADLQVTAAQQSMNDGQAKQNALIDLYGTANHTDPLASAYSFQGQEQQDAEQQKAAREKQKYAFDEFTKVAKAVDDGVIEPKAATDYYHNAMKLSGIDLQAAGVNLEFQKAKGGYFSGPVAPDTIFMMNGVPTPYGAQGIVSKARIVGQDPQSGKPIFEMDENTTFAEAKSNDHETWGEPYQANVGGKRAMMQKSNRGQVRSVLADNSTTVKINTGGSKTGGGSGAVRMPSAKPPVGYRYTAEGELEPIPGGPAAQKVTTAAKSQEGAVQSINTAIEAAQSLLNHPGREAATGFSSLTNALAAPGGNAKTFLNDLETFKSQMFIPMVQQMKGMGQLSDAEGKKLLAAVGNLETSSSEGAFTANLNKVIQGLQQTLKRAEQPITTGPTGKQPARNAAKTIDSNTAQRFLKQAGGNKDRARELARKAGYSF